MKHHNYALFGLLLLCFLPFSINGIDVRNTGQIRSDSLQELALLDKQRVGEIKLMLPDKPKGIGESYQNREYWVKLNSSGKYNAVLRKADQLVIENFPKWDQNRYRSLSTEGTSGGGKKFLLERLEWLITLTWAECLVNDNKYVPSVEKTLTELCKQQTWANERDVNEGSSKFNVELSSARYASNIAQCLYLLDGKISDPVKKEVLKNLESRIFNPILTTLETRDKNHWWLTGTNNWNAVCLAGVVSSALAVIEDKSERAKFAFIGERYSNNYLSGFSADGYCSEGVSYYNYGFRNYIILRECIYQATKGEIDLFKNPKIKRIAEFLLKSEIVNNVYPAISDCPPNTKGDKAILFYVNRTLGMGMASYDNLKFLGRTRDLVADLMLVSLNNASSTPPSTRNKFSQDLKRSYFEQAGVLTVRSESNNAQRAFGATLKGGSNAELHNHNDVGSYSVVAGNELLMGDPGSIPYTGDMFGSKRYKYKTISSYGHPVPLIAGVLQHEGPDARATITNRSFSDNQDRLDMDILSAYKVSGMRKMSRSFVFNRKEDSNLVVSDEFEFTSKNNFETALITRAKWSVEDEKTIILRGKTQTLTATIQCSDKFSIQSQEISEKGTPYTRIAIRIDNPVNKGFVKVTYERR